MKQLTLCLLTRENKKGKEILLGMKKRGFGVGKWNGIGGKFDSQKGDKNIEDTAKRETKEEIGVEVEDLRKVGFLNFRFPNKPKWNQDVYVFLVKNWQGTPSETEEIKPKWFPEKEIPFTKMWAADKFWLPYILEGKELKAEFIYRKDKVSEKKIKFV